MNKNEGEKEQNANPGSFLIRGSAASFGPRKPRGRPAKEIDDDASSGASQKDGEAPGFDRLQLKRIQKEDKTSKLPSQALSIFQLMAQGKYLLYSPIYTISTVRPDHISVDTALDFYMTHRFLVPSNHVKLLSAGIRQRMPRVHLEEELIMDGVSVKYRFPSSASRKKLDKETMHFSIRDDIIQSLFLFEKGASREEIVNRVLQIRTARSRRRANRSSETSSSVHNSKIRKEISNLLNSIKKTKKYEIFVYQWYPDALDWYILRRFVTPKAIPKIIEHFCRYLKQNASTYKDKTVDLGHITNRMLLDYTCRQFELWQLRLQRFCETEGVMTQIQSAFHLLFQQSESAAAADVIGTGNVTTYLPPSRVQLKRTGIGTQYAQEMQYFENILTILINMPISPFWWWITCHLDEHAQNWVEQAVQPILKSPLIDQVSKLWVQSDPFDLAGLALQFSNWSAYKIPIFGTGIWNDTTYYSRWRNAEKSGAVSLWNVLTTTTTTHPSAELNGIAITNNDDFDAVDSAGSGQRVWHETFAAADVGNRLDFQYQLPDYHARQEYDEEWLLSSATIDPYGTSAEPEDRLPYPTQEIQQKKDDLKNGRPTSFVISVREMAQINSMRRVEFVEMLMDVDPLSVDFHWPVWATDPVFIDYGGHLQNVEYHAGGNVDGADGSHQEDYSAQMDVDEPAAVPPLEPIQSAEVWLGSMTDAEWRENSQVLANRIFASYPEYLRQHPELRWRLESLGYQTDVLPITHRTMLENLDALRFQHGGLAPYEFLHHIVSIYARYLDGDIAREPSYLKIYEPGGPLSSIPHSAPPGGAFDWSTGTSKGIGSMPFAPVLSPVGSRTTPVYANPGAKVIGSMPSAPALSPVGSRTAPVYANPGAKVIGSMPSAAALSPVGSRTTPIYANLGANDKGQLQRNVWQLAVNRFATVVEDVDLFRSHRRQDILAGLYQRKSEIEPNWRCEDEEQYYAVIPPQCDERVKLNRYKELLRLGGLPQSVDFEIQPRPDYWVTRPKSILKNGNRGGGDVSGDGRRSGATTGKPSPSRNQQQLPVKKTTSTQARPVNPQQLPVKKTTSTPSPPKQAVGAKRATSGMPPSRDHL